MSFQFSVPCLMGVEALVADELRFNHFENVQAENGRVLFTGEWKDCARANVIVRCGERVLLRLGAFRAETFDQLFEGVRALPWEDFIGRSDAFPVKGHSLHSKLFSVPDCQKIIKKAVVRRLESVYGQSWFEESGAKCQIQFSIIRDVCEVSLDTTGPALYKRGYKLNAPEATLRETLAASMVKLARYRGREDFLDPFCGAGTIAIEAAMAANRIAPGARRDFDAEDWGCVPVDVFDEVRQAAIAEEKHEALSLTASDISAEAVELTRENARRAGVADCIRVERADALSLSYRDRSGILMTNPPYGVRLLDVEQAREIYSELGRLTRGAPALKQYILTSDESFEQMYGRPCDKKRKLYNGMLKCGLCMYFK